MPNSCNRHTIGDISMRFISLSWWLHLNWSIFYLFIVVDNFKCRLLVLYWIPNVLNSRKYSLETIFFCILCCTLATFSNKKWTFLQNVSIFVFFLSFSQHYLIVCVYVTSSVADPDPDPVFLGHPDPDP